MPPFPQPEDQDSSDTIALRRRSPLTFFLVVFALSIPFGFIGTVTRRQLLPGCPAERAHARLPVQGSAARRMDAGDGPAWHD
jgi:hypothetical protein